MPWSISEPIKFNQLIPKMGKVHLNDLDKYQKDNQSYKPIKTNKKKKVGPIYIKDSAKGLED